MFSISFYQTEGIHHFSFWVFTAILGVILGDLLQLIMPIK